MTKKQYTPKYSAEFRERGVRLFRSGGPRPSLETITCFIDEHRRVCGVELICKVLQIEPSTSYARTAIMRNPDLASSRVKQDAVNREKISDVYEASGRRYGARKLVGWRLSTSMTTRFVLNALNQAICQRVPSQADKLIHHSEQGSQVLSIKYTERLAEAGIDPSVGRVGDRYDKAMADRYNEKRLHSVLHYQTPNKKENAYFQNLKPADKAA